MRSDDVALIDELFARLTPESRYTRFHGPKPQLSSADRAGLASVDGRSRLAFAAIGCGGQPLAVAHAFRFREHPTVAEVAVMVADGNQRLGLGTALIGCLAARVAALGIERLVAFVLSETSLATTLMRRGWQVTEYDGVVTTLSVDALLVADEPAAPGD